MRISMVTLATVIFIGALFLIGCGSRSTLAVAAPTPIPTLAPATLPAALPATEAAPGGATSAPAGAPAAPAAPVASPAALSAAGTAGKSVFDNNCGVCHSVTSQTMVGPGLAGIFQKPQLPNGKPVNIAGLADWIHTGGSGLSGFGAMPGFPQIQGSDLSNLIAYLQEATAAPAAASSTAPAAAPSAAASSTITATAAASLAVTATAPSAVAAPAGSASTGKAVYDTNCAGCHSLTAAKLVGPGLAGLFGLSQLPNGKPVTDADLADWIHNGGGGLAGYGPMPGLAQIQGADMTNLIAYLKQATGAPAAAASTAVTATAAAPAPAATAAPVATTAVTVTAAAAPATSAVTTTSAAGDATAGQAVFEATCSRCHNLTAEKKVGPGLAGLFGFAQLPNGKPVTDANLTDWIHTGGSGLAGYPPMRAFPDVQGADLSNLIAYLKQATAAATTAAPATTAGGSSAAPAPQTAPSVAATAAATTAASSTVTPTAAPAAAATAAVTTTAGDATAGKAVFDSNCVFCHNLTAEKLVGPGLAGVFNLPQLPNGKPVTDANVADWIHTGGSGLAGYPPMPPYPQITGADLANLIAYLKDATK